jgi:hypothetical protein
MQIKAIPYLWVQAVMVALPVLLMVDMPQADLVFPDRILFLRLLLQLAAVGVQVNSIPLVSLALAVVVVAAHILLFPAAPELQVKDMLAVITPAKYEAVAAAVLVQQVLLLTTEEMAALVWPRLLRAHL